MLLVKKNNTVFQWIRNMRYDSLLPVLSVPWLVHLTICPIESMNIHFLCFYPSNTIISSAFQILECSQTSCRDGKHAKFIKSPPTCRHAWACREGQGGKDKDRETEIWKAMWMNIPYQSVGWWSNLCYMCANRLRKQGTYPMMRASRCFHWELCTRNEGLGKACPCYVIFLLPSVLAAADLTTYC